ncbi:ATPase inhibitor [Taxawa tesnikishii (nom. ined.)]|nr:ATPase inhibitor [Dothideales sp. JES 119]
MTYTDHLSLQTMSAALRVVRAARPATRSFSSITRRMAAGDTGAPRSGGAAHSDAFTKREEASEALYIRQHEKEKLAALKKKIADQEAQLAKDRQEAEELSHKKDA